MFSDCDLKEIGSMLIAEKAAPQTLSAREKYVAEATLNHALGYGKGRNAL